MAHWGHHNQVPSRQMQVKCLPYLHQIGKHQDGLCQHCNKPDTITHFLTECRHSATCLAVLADCRKLNLTPTLYIVLSDSRLHSAIVSSLNRTIWYWLVLLFSLLTTKIKPTWCWPTLSNIAQSVNCKEAFSQNSIMCSHKLLSFRSRMLCCRWSSELC